MTNGWTDMRNTDMTLVMGGNPAENHPCGFKWVVEAKRNRNAKLIVVDPRFTRTAAVADLFLQIRAGSDIAFLGGLINYASPNNRINKEYVVNYTNAAFVVKEGFKLPEDGLYSGFDPEKQTYDKSTWNYEEGGDLTGKAAAGASMMAAAMHAPASAPKAAVPEHKSTLPRPRAMLPRHRPRRCCPPTPPTTSRWNIRAASTSSSRSSTRATRRRWSSASRASPKTSS